MNNGRPSLFYSSIPGGRFSIFRISYGSTQVLNSVISVLLRQETATWGGLNLGTLDSGSRITGVGGPGTPPFWRTRKERCTELGSVTLKRIGLFCFPIKHSTHTECQCTVSGKACARGIGYGVGAAMEWGDDILGPATLLCCHCCVCHFGHFQHLW